MLLLDGDGVTEPVSQRSGGEKYQTAGFTEKSFTHTFKAAASGEANANRGVSEPDALREALRKVCATQTLEASGQAQAEPPTSQTGGKTNFALQIPS